MNTKSSWIAGTALVILIAVGAYWFWPRKKLPTKPPLTVVGVGLYLGRNQTTHLFEVRKVFPNSPAEKAGLVPGMVLNKVNDTIAETNSIKGLSTLLSGPVGSKVTVEMIDAGGATNDVEILREKFVNKTAR